MIMPSEVSRCARAVCAAVLLFTRPASAAELRGRVHDGATLAGLRGASVTLDALPPDGAAEFSASADAFGFFTLTNIPADSYRLRAAHPGYVPFTADEALAAGSNYLRNLPLARVPGDPTRFDVLVTVACVKSGHLLEGVGVRVLRYLDDVDPAPVETNYVVTDVNGLATLAGAQPGYYTFAVNDPAHGAARPGWESHQTPARRELRGPHVAQALLKPVEQALTVRVRGFDPRGSTGLSNQPLPEVHVELEGVNPRDPDEVFIPVRVGVTDAAGEAVFTNLPAIAWRVVTERFGHTVVTNVIFPGAADTLPTVLEVTNQPVFAPLGIIVESPYMIPTMMTGLVVRVTGLTNSATEGITRVVTAELVDPPGPEPPLAGALVPALMGGRYELSVTGLVQSAAIKSGAFDPAGTFTVAFTGGEIVELTPGVTTILPVPVTPEPATVRVRMHTADAMSEIPEAGADGVLTNRPAWARRVTEPLVFKESAVADLLQPPFRTVVFGTDETGEQRVSLTPGVYGVEAPFLTGYFGSAARLRNLTTGEEITHGWPFAANPDVPPAFPLSPHHALGLRFNSGHEYELDLFARKELYDVCGEVKPDPLDPHRQRVVALSGTNHVATRFTDLVDGGLATLAGHPPAKPLTLRSELVTNALAGAPNARFAFDDVPPGTRSLSVTHPRHTFTAHSGGATLAVALPDWGPPGIVDGDDAADAAAGLFPLETLWLQGAGGAPAFSATLAAAHDTVRVNYFRWTTDAGGSYVAEGTAENPDYFIADPTPGSILSRFPGPERFRMGARTWDLYFAFSETNWFRTTLTATNTGYEHVRNCYISGPSNNVIGPLRETFALTVRAENEADPAQTLSNVTVSLAGGGTVETPFQTNDHAGSLTATAVSHATWVWTGEQVLSATGPRDLVLTVKMRRGMGVAGLVRDATNGAPVPDALVRLFSRFGTPLHTTNAATNGAYVFPALPNAQPVFVDVSAPGYVAYRVRHAPAAGAPDYAGTNGLVAIPPPRILSNTVDRFGLFLPRVRRAGNTGNYTDFNATDALTMTWRVVAEERVFVQDHSEFDRPDGGQRSVFAPVTDAIAETWLVDARGFAGNPYDGQATNLPLPAVTDAAAVRRWLQDARAGRPGTVFLRRVEGRAPLPPPGTNVETRANVPLWELPPGTNRLVFVTLTRRGAATWSELPGASADHRLRGETLPKWLAFAADLMGTVAGIQAATGVNVTEAQVSRFVPAGRFVALPQFTADIRTNSGFVSYDYGLKVRAREGQDTPRFYLLAFAPRTLGLEFGAEARFGLSGLSNRFYLAINADVTAAARSNNLDLMRSSAVREYFKPTGTFQVEAGVGAALEYAGGARSLLEVDDHVGGSASLRMKFNLRPLTSKIPYAGPVLLALDKTEGLQMFGSLEGGVGLVVSNRWRTVYPPSAGDGSGSVAPGQTYRRHLFGGEEQTTATTVFQPCVRFGVGGEIRAVRGAASGSLQAALQGSPCGGLNALRLDIGPVGDWRTVTRVRGAFNLRANLRLDLHLCELNKTLFNKDLFPLDYQLGTETVFDLIEVSESTAALLPATGPLSAYVPAGRDRVRNVFRPGATEAFPGALGYTEIDGGTGEIVFRLATDCAGASPARVASAPGLLAIAATRLPSGRWLAAWSEIAAADIGNPYAASVIKSSLSDTNCAHWSAPVLVATLPDTATDLRFVAGGAFTGLVWRHAAEGPLSLRAGLGGARWDGAAWSAPGELLAIQDIAQHDAAGGAGTPAALIAWTDGAGGLRSLAWDGTNVAGPHTAGTNALGALDLAADTGGQFHLAWNSRDGGVQLSRFDGASAWTLVATSATDTVAAELQLAPLTAGGTNLWMLAWIDGADATALHYAVVTAAGAPWTTNTPVAFADTGRYSHLRLVADTALTARLLARYTGTNDVTDLREFTATAAGFAPWLLNPAPTGGGVSFDLLGYPGQPVRVQSSSNLVDWMEFLNFIPTNAPTPIQDPSPRPHRFYRAVSP